MSDIKKKLDTIDCTKNKYFLEFILRVLANYVNSEKSNSNKVIYSITISVSNHIYIELEYI